MRSVCPLRSTTPVSFAGLTTGSNSGWSVFAEKRSCVTWSSGEPKVTLT
jgi:hypothetical protein